ncbi:MAG TPA: hypothetical protein VJC18_09440, partial [bacterium]|nr:hypothetical protein [bacterium]
IKKAGELFPDRPEIKQIIEQAWAEVKVLGKQAISADMAYEIPEGVEGREIIDIFRLDPRLITELENKVQATTLPEGVRRCKVGFVLDENLNASLVCIAYVSEGGKLDLDNLIEGVPVVKFKV